LSVRQHVTAPSLPQVDLAAHVSTRFRQPDARRPSRVALFTTLIVQETYCPWFLADAQSHCSSASARIAASESGSQGPGRPCKPWPFPWSSPLFPWSSPLFPWAAAGCAASSGTTNTRASRLRPN